MNHLLGEEEFSFDTRGGQIHVRRADTSVRDADWEGECGLGVA